MAKQKKPVKPLPFPVYFWTTTAVALVGLADATYLAVSHYRVYMDMGYKSFCAVSKAINCDTVSQSPFSILFGVPVPVWGVAGYLFFLMVLAIASKLKGKNARIWPTLTLVTLFFSTYSIALAFISLFYIRSYCIMCIVSYAVNLLLLYFCWLTYRRFAKESIIFGFRNDIAWFAERKTAAIFFISGASMIIVALTAFFPAYWEFTSKKPVMEMPTGLTKDGHPWIGAEDPQITISEFTDYQCFQCKKLHFYLRQLISTYPGKVRLVHRNFPMDHAYNPLVKEPFHVGSGKMALFSLFAAEKGKFWAVNDMLFNVDTQEGHFNLRGIAKEAGFDVEQMARSVNDRLLLRRLKIDIRDGLKLGITGTPAYVVDGKVYVGNVPADIFKELGD